MASNTAPIRRGMDAFKKTRESVSSSFYSAEAKDRLVNDAVPLYLHTLSLDQENQFGPRWLLGLSEQTDEAPIGLLGMASNGWRDRFFEGLTPALADGAVGPLQLTRIKTKNGQTAYDLVEWEPF